MRKLRNRHLLSRIGQQDRRHSTSVGCRPFCYLKNIRAKEKYHESAISNSFHTVSSIVVHIIVSSIVLITTNGSLLPGAVRITKRHLKRQKEKPLKKVECALASGWNLRVWHIFLLQLYRESTAGIGERISMSFLNTLSVLSAEKILNFLTNIPSAFG